MARHRKTKGRVHESGLVGGKREKRSGLVGGKGVKSNLSDLHGRVRESGLVGGGKITESSLANPRRSVLGI